jgi:CheY-like chemotaxis protein
MTTKILIIEDDIFIGNILTQKLVSAKFETQVIRDGALAISKIKEWRPDLILLDMTLPNMSGYEILETKQKDFSIPDIPVIIISNSGKTVEINRALALGVKSYLVKTGLNSEEVLVKVERELAKKKVAVPETKPHEIPHADLVGKKILWVEDDKFLKDIITRKLSKTGCMLFHASTGEEALERVSKEIPDIIVLDIILPGMNGFEILQKIKEKPEAKNIPVIFLSNLDQKSDIDKGKALGAVRFFVKATGNLDEIVDEIKVVLAEAKK